MAVNGQIAADKADYPMKKISDPRSRVGVVREFDLDNFGSLALRFGDLTGSGVPDMVFARGYGQLAPIEANPLVCLTAMDVDGKILWQRGSPASGDLPPLFGDVACQVHDLNGDGRNEVVGVMGNRLLMLEGATGKTIFQAELPEPGASDCLAFADLAGQGRAGEVLIKDRYRKFWALSGKDFHVLWRYQGDTGHFPCPGDVNGDGRDEIMVGDTLLSADGRVLWKYPFGTHADAIAIRKIEGRPFAGMGIITAGDGVTLFDGGGKAYFQVEKIRGMDQFPKSETEGKEGFWSDLWEKPQHIAVGDYGVAAPTPQIAALNRHGPRDARGHAIFYLLDAAGNTLWRYKDVVGSVCAVVKRIAWFGEGAEDLVLYYARPPLAPALLVNGRGEVVEELPDVLDPQNMPPPDKWGYLQTFCYHVDLVGDEREEVVMTDGRKLRLYENVMPRVRPPPAKRVQSKGQYNTTGYTGESA